MGNQLGNLFPQRPQQQFLPNIPFNQNDINHPFSAQIQDIVLHYAVPLFCIAALACGVHKSKQNIREVQEKVEKETTELRDLVEKLKEQQKYAVHAISFHALVQKQLAGIEETEDKILQDQLKHLKYYENELETILDIRCSIFKSKERRIEIQDELITRRTSEKSGVNYVKYLQLKDIYDNDYRFCSYSKEQNGKLRQLYGKQWKIEMERDKYKRILDKLKHLNSDEK